MGTSFVVTFLGRLILYHLWDHFYTTFLSFVGSFLYHFKFLVLLVIFRTDILMLFTVTFLANS